MSVDEVDKSQRGLQALLGWLEEHDEALRVDYRSGKQMLEFITALLDEVAYIDSSTRLLLDDNLGVSFDPKLKIIASVGPRDDL